jgi:hypothetical protein
MGVLASPTSRRDGRAPGAGVPQGERISPLRLPRVSENETTCVILRHTQAYFPGRRDFDTLRSAVLHDIEVVTS